MKLLIIDNYDSFTYNIVQLLRNVTDIEPDVKRNDCFELSELSDYDKIVLSPGPGIPAEAGLLNEAIRIYGPHKSMLGICLGHQAIAEVYGAQLVNMRQVLHGVASNLKVCNKDPLFEGLPETIQGGHYHSWIVSSVQLPEELEVLMEDSTGRIMALRHKQYDLKGLQFHPESVLTPLGHQIITNWINH